MSENSSNVYEGIKDGLPPRQETKNVLEQKVQEQVENLAPEDKAALFFNMYGHKLHNYLSQMSLKQIRRAYMNALGNKDPKYAPKTQEEKFVSWATDKLVEIKTMMQMHLLNEKLKNAEEEFKKNENMEDKLIQMEIDKTNAEKSAEGETNG